MTKKTTSKKPTKSSMEIELFEKKYHKQIELMTESILDTLTTLNDNNYEEEYDKAYDDAVYVLASDKKVKLID
jgi:hypothetical protein